MLADDMFVIDFNRGIALPLHEASDDALRMAWRSMAPPEPPEDPFFRSIWEKSRGSEAENRTKTMRNLIRAEINRRIST
jgi:hypothetical protein